MKGKGRSIRTGEYLSSHRGPDMPQVDLHGLRAHIGEERLRKFMEDQIRNRIQRVLVIHGHGRGTMREIVDQWIETHGHRIVDVESTHNDGAKIIRLRHH
ncbi:MAG TPA: Smr/MutS family protein [Verrucomicrobiae bacterium]|nr:Smr/MutS family protein [Verrucomicrobiae bacterium]